MNHVLQYFNTVVRKILLLIIPLSFLNTNIISFQLGDVIVFVNLLSKDFLRENWGGGNKSQRTEMSGQWC